MRKLVLVFLGASLLVGCEATRTVAESTFHVIDAPRRYIKRQLDRDEDTTTTTTQTTVYHDTDVERPGQPMPPPQGTTGVTNRRTSKPPVQRSTDGSQATSRRPPATQGDLPYGKPVPGKPGYVFSPFDPSGGYVDVTGYSPGSKVKDPYSGKIFLVP